MVTTVEFIDSMYIKVRVTAAAKEERFERVGDLYKIRVKEKAEMNMANRRVFELLSKNLSIPISKIRLISGHRSPSKIFNIMV